MFKFKSFFVILVSVLSFNTIAAPWPDEPELTDVYGDYYGGPIITDCPQGWNDQHYYDFDMNDPMEVDKFFHSAQETLFSYDEFLRMRNKSIKELTEANNKLTEEIKQLKAGSSIDPNEITSLKDQIMKLEGELQEALDYATELEHKNDDLNAKYTNACAAYTKESELNSALKEELSLAYDSLKQDSIMLDYYYNEFVTYVGVATQYMFEADSLKEVNAMLKAEIEDDAEVYERTVEDYISKTDALNKDLEEAKESISDLKYEAAVKDEQLDYLKGKISEFSELNGQYLEEKEKEKSEHAYWEGVAKSRENDLALANDSIASLWADLYSCDAQGEELAKDLNETKSELKDLSENFGKYAEDLQNEFNKMTGVYLDSIKNANERINKLETNLAESWHELQYANDRRVILNDSVIDLNEKLLNTKVELAGCQNDNTELASNNESLKEDIRGLNSDLDYYATATENLNKKIVEFEQNVDDLQKVITAKSEELDKVKSDLTKAQEDLTEAQADLNKATAWLNETEDSLDAANEKLTIYTEENAKLTSTVAGLETEKATLTGKVNSLTETLNKETEYATELADELEVANKERDAYKSSFAEAEASLDEVQTSLTEIKENNFTSAEALEDIIVKINNITKSELTSGEIKEDDVIYFNVKGVKTDSKYSRYFEVVVGSNGIKTVKIAK